ncbi:MAG TPA: heparan-alpha-glucosaminide N-acetyltransferase domain-containing protein [Spirochaetota bacterium]|nr:heparan-alpha-glucosaminide N-acetyltransferase domain-containing protein [Spirochaetota bacterium]
MDSRNRFLFVDLLRGAALTVMIEVHVFNTFLIPEYRDALWFPFLNFINGLVAPSFIFISGFAFILSSKSGLDEMRSFKWKFWRKLGMIALIFLVAYSMHIPFFSFKNILIWASPSDLKSFYNVDVLQCIGAALLILFFSRLAIRSDRLFHIFTITMALVFTLFAPVLWNTDFSIFMPLPLACYFNEMNGSYFPIFPWAGFLFAGAAVSTYYLKARETFIEKDFIKKLFIFGLTSAVICFIILAWLDTFSWFQLKPSPLFFLERFGAVAVLLSACWYYYRNTGAAAGFFLDVSRQSLVVYWLHLQLIYRRLWNDRSLSSIAYGNFGIDECLLATAILLAAMMTTAYTWGWIKQERPVLANIIFYVTIYGSIALFFII